MSTQQMISIAECIAQTGIDEDEFRILLSESHPDDYDNIQDISVEEFELILKTIKARSQGFMIAPEVDYSLPQHQQELIITSVSNALTSFTDSYAVDLIQLTNALAYVTAQRALANFQGTFENTLNQGLNDYASSLTNSLVAQIHQVAGLNNSDFLERRGVKPQGIKRNSSKVLEAMKVIEDLQDC